MFELDPRLEKSSDFVCDLTLSQVRLSHNAHFPWLILIPKKNDVAELLDLPPVDQQELFKEILKVSSALKDFFSPYKLNIGALGNVVRQLHIHVIARFETDAAWPNPVWNTVFKPYEENEKQHRIEKIRQLLLS
ncbi:MAG TPA: HIT family protein [Alphaproteobacteria bacterium]|nr:HIT family protein [Alphaproteobacteria bacterium]